MTPVAVTIPGAREWLSADRRYRKAMWDRDQAILRAFEDDVPAKEIADAFKLTRERVYQIVGRP